MSKDYEVIKKRLAKQAGEIRDRVDTLNDEREALFGRSELELVSQSVLRTDSRGVARDLAVIDGTLLLGFNARVGMKARTHVEDVFAPFRVSKDGSGVSFTALESFSPLQNDMFGDDFDELYRFFKGSHFKSFKHNDLMLYLNYGVGDAGDVRRFRFAKQANGEFAYVDNAGHQSYPAFERYNFEWISVSREMHVGGKFPHISIDDELFVETIGGDLTIKLEDNTASGRGIYEEPVEDANQGLGDAEIRYARIGRLILLDILPFRESQHRYFVFNTLTKDVARADGVGLSTSVLPNESGIVFPGGYALGEGKVHNFAGDWSGFQMDEVIVSPNGEDLLYVFFNPAGDEYALMHFNTIRKAFANPMRCDGFSFLADGTLLVLRGGEPSSNHPVQVFRSPFSAESVLIENGESSLANVGNADLVAGISDLFALIRMVEDQSPSVDIYKALKLSAQHVLDKHYWLDHDEIGVAGDVRALIASAEQALESFERAEAQKAETANVEESLKQKSAELRKILRDVSGDLEGAVDLIAKTRALSGEIVGAKERRYADQDVLEGLAKEAGELRNAATDIAVERLLEPDALDRYHRALSDMERGVESLETTVEAKELGLEIGKVSEDIGLLTDTVSALEFDDSVKRTAILERLGEVLASQNRVHAKWDARHGSLAESEGQAEFAVQLQLLEQTTSSIMATCKDVESCDAGLARVSAQIEEMEQRFGALPKFFEALTERREAVVSLFSNRRESLVQDAAERASAMERAAATILPGIERRAKSLAPSDLVGFFATDSSALKVKELAETLRDGGFAVQADDVLSKLATVRDRMFAASQDRADLFDGEMLKLGAHRFTVNSSRPELATVAGQNGVQFHVTGTDYRLEVPDVEGAFSQRLRSENDEVYRAEFLAYQVWRDGGDVRELMDVRLDEGYARGVHDVDAQNILHAIRDKEASVGQMRWSPEVRSKSAVEWAFLDASLQEVQSSKIRANALLGRATDYLGTSVSNGAFAISSKAFEAAKQCPEEFRAEISTLVELGEIEVAFELATVFGDTVDGNRHEIAAVLVCGERINWDLQKTDLKMEAPNMIGAHPTIADGVWSDSIDRFFDRMERFVDQEIPKWEAAKELLAGKTEAHAKVLDLASFEPKVMHGFVRNTLIDEVYLPLIGNNFAKQLGSVSDAGGHHAPSGGLLLMTSPPGYGKTTLMEYVAQRLGLMFVKVNGPSLGHHTLSLDPEQAPDASARREIEKVNLAFEFGNNVMLYIDDIQHCSSEFLQKFISLCDATRRVEGVFRGEPKTYDLRGKRFCVVMAGNPYTETGDRFEVPDMLANRADTYNLGDVLQGAEVAFADSYVENAMGANAATKPFSSDKKYAKALIAAAQEREIGDALDGFPAHDVDDATKVVRHMLRVRDVVSTINQAYISSAAVEANYRTEPAFLLQGSYRNFNKISQAIAPVMSDEEVNREIENHYQQEAQTLTSASEFNLLKFKRFVGSETAESNARFDEIVAEFKRRNVYGDDDAVSRIALPLASIAQQLGSISEGGGGANLEEALGKIETALKRDNGVSSLKMTVERLVRVVEQLQLQSGNAKLAETLDHQLAIIETALLPLAKAAQEDEGEAA